MVNWEAIFSKMKVMPEMAVLVVNAPAHIRPFGTEITCIDTPSSVPGHSFPAGILFAVNSAELANYAASFTRTIEPDGLLWIAYPKKTSSLISDLHRDNGWQVVYKLGLKPVAQVAIDDDWSAVRFRPGVAPHTGHKSLSELVVPDDLINALQSNGLQDVFAALANTHRKEFINWINEARKDSTRQDRIAKTIEMVTAGKHRS